MAAQITMPVSVRIRLGRLQHMRAHATAQVRRAPRRDRGALIQRYIQMMIKSCVIVEVGHARQCTSFAHHGSSPALTHAGATSASFA
jgi:hypothetical protein